MSTGLILVKWVVADPPLCNARRSATNRNARRSATNRNARRSATNRNARRSATNRNARRSATNRNARRSATAAYRLTWSVVWVKWKGAWGTLVVCKQVLEFTKFMTCEKCLNLALHRRHRESIFKPRLLFECSLWATWVWIKCGFYSSVDFYWVRLLFTTLRYTYVCSGIWLSLSCIQLTNMVVICGRPRQGSRLLLCIQ